MKLILNGINGHYLRYVTDNFAEKTEEVLAAVAYATESKLLFDWCWENNISLKFWGRLDKDVAVALPILKSFLDRKSTRFTCKLVRHHHAKIIWWKGVGVYIGSANLTDKAWVTNVEAGCFFEESEITSEMESDLGDFFSKLEQHASPLTDELFKEMEKRSKELAGKREHGDDFYNKPSFRNWAGLVYTAPKTANENRKNEFLKEWHSTLQELRNIGDLVSKDENRPAWVPKDAPAGTQADQFLHAHYFQRTFDGRKANYEAFFEKNRTNPEASLHDAVKWWRSLQSAPSSEARTLNESVPILKKLLSKETLQQMTYEQFREICSRVYAIEDYSRRVANKAVFLPETGERYSMDQKVAALSVRIWNDISEGGEKITDVLLHVLYGGSDEQLPERIWSAVTDPKWKIEGLGISAYGELVGWALPEKFPPRNGRTSKALKSLGYDVTIHVS